MYKLLFIKRSPENVNFLVFSANNNENWTLHAADVAHMFDLFLFYKQNALTKRYSLMRIYTRIVERQFLRSFLFEALPSTATNHLYFIEKRMK